MSVSRIESIFYQRLLAQLADQDARIKDAVMTGCSDWEAYQRLLGQHYGVTEAIDIASQLYDGMLKE